MEQRVRAIIIDGDEIVLIKRVKPNEVYFVFPGGGVESGESLEQALVRECREELGVEVMVHELIYKNDKIIGQEKEEYFFRCSLISGILGTGDGPEFAENNNYVGTHEVIKVNLYDLKGIKLYPENIKDMVLEKYS